MTGWEDNLLFLKGSHPFKVVKGFNFTVYKIGEKFYVQALDSKG